MTRLVSSRLVSLVSLVSLIELPICMSMFKSERERERERVNLRC